MYFEWIKDADKHEQLGGNPRDHAHMYNRTILCLRYETPPPPSPSSTRPVRHRCSASPHISPAEPSCTPIDPARAPTTLAARPRALATDVTAGSIVTAREANEKGC